MLWAAQWAFTRIMDTITMEEQAMQVVHSGGAGCTGPSPDKPQQQVVQKWRDGLPGPIQNGAHGGDVLRVLSYCRGDGDVNELPP